MRRIARTVFVVLSLCMAWTHQPVAAQVVNYSGTVVDPFASFAPVANGFVIAGTFKPTFDPYQYSCVYGSDAFCNMDSTRYSQAVADGNFIPIGAGTATLSDGSFSTSGSNLQGPGQQLWLFGFSYADPDLSNDMVLASSPSWITSASPLEINTSDATLFVFGSPFGTAIALNGGLPVPEPNIALLGGVAACVASMARRKRRRVDGPIRRQLPQFA
jgi:hypothetical protein